MLALTDGRIGLLGGAEEGSSSRGAVARKIGARSGLRLTARPDDKWRQGKGMRRQGRADGGRFSTVGPEELNLDRNVMRQ